VGGHAAKENPSYMTASSMSLPDRVLRPGRRAVFALVASAGVALSPVPALVAAPPAAAAEASAESSTAPSQAAQTAVDTAMDQRGKPTSGVARARTPTTARA
jgi:hypothetical protein